MKTKKTTRKEFLVSPIVRPKKTTTSTVEPPKDRGAGIKAPKEGLKPPTRSEIAAKKEKYKDSEGKKGGGMMKSKMNTKGGMKGGGMMKSKMNTKGGMKGGGMMKSKMNTKGGMKGGGMMKSKMGMKMGGLKTPTADQKGLKKLPEEVRNNMGFKKAGGMMKTKGYAMGGMKTKGYAVGGVKTKGAAKSSGRGRGIESKGVRPAKMVKMRGA